jgi:hypothetical protein
VKYLATLCAGLRALMIAALAGAPASAQAPGGTNREAAEWNAARGAGTVEAFQHYLELYPLGRYSGEAFRYIIELTIDPDATVAGPEAGPEGAPSVSTRGLGVDMY